MKKEIKLVYVAGKYTHKEHYGVMKNIDAAKDVAMVLWGSGFFTYCPHLNTGCFGGLCPEKTFIDGHIAFLRMCDAVVLVDGWETSKGTLAEIEEARKNSIPIFESVDDLLEYTPE